MTLKPGQAVSIPRPFLEQLYDADAALERGIFVEVAPEGRPPIPRKLCALVCYSNERYGSLMPE